MSTHQTNQNQPAIAGQVSSTTASSQASVSLGDAVFALSKLRKFIGSQQKTALGQLIEQEERQFFWRKLIEIAGIVEAMPRTYQTDGQGDQAIAYLHYFMSGFDWYITELDMSEVQLQAFGLACLWEKELGYISIQELLDIGAELDLHWTPRLLSDI